VQECRQVLREDWLLAEKAEQVPAFQVNDTIDIAGMLGQDRPTWMAQKFDSGLRKGAA
jgi:hypothetical protein